MKTLPIHEQVIFTKTKTGRRYLTPKEAAAYLGIGFSTLGIHRMKGTGPAYIKWGRSNIRYDVESLDSWMDAHRVTPEPMETAKRRVGRPKIMSPVAVAINFKKGVRAQAEQ